MPKKQNEHCEQRCGGSNRLTQTRNAYVGFLFLWLWVVYYSVTDWELLERVWEHAVETRLKVRLSDHPILVSEKPFNTSKDRMKYTVREANRKQTTPYDVDAYIVGGTPSQSG